ncbi:hypothetical protein [Aeromicrobium massiliense]|uniref:hypothetical protein n=1 Tax=Aeromicrobium massiliense TaxID=1464554 RepID=UPI0002D70F7A|nr:hypothetical protein [Aeromicrobium massiliense]
MSDQDPSDDEFRRLVEGLDLDFSAMDEADARRARERAVEPPAEEPTVDEPWELDDEPDDDAFYRHPEPPPARRADPRRQLGWTGLLGGPAVLVIGTLLGVNLPQAVVLGAVLIFVAAAVVLVSTLPGYGPSHRDFPDDGAVL